MRSTTTSTLTVNPAFLREIKEDHRLLRELLDRTVALFSRPRLALAQPSLLVELLASVRDQIAMHFALEEAYGYFEEAVSVAPRLSARAAELMGQHQKLYSAICVLAEDAEGLLDVADDDDADPVFSRLKRGFEEFYDALQRHEACENALILQAFEEDLGAGD